MGFVDLLYWKAGKAVLDSDGDMNADAGDTTTQGIEGGVAGAGESSSRREDQLHDATWDRFDVRLARHGNGRCLRVKRTASQAAPRRHNLLLGR
jgi:hypothetical protein